MMQAGSVSKRLKLASVLAWTVTSRLHILQAPFLTEGAPTMQAVNDSHRHKSLQARKPVS